MAKPKIKKQKNSMVFEKHQVSLNKKSSTHFSSNSNPVYALAFSAHPDDVELACAATILQLKQEKKTIGFCDLTEGEMGTRGSRMLRKKEAAKAAEILGVKERINLNLGDTTFVDSLANREKIVSVIRYFQPTIVFATQPSERHPDHERSSHMIREACFYAGLQKVETRWNKIIQPPHKVPYLLFYIQDRFTEPDFIVDVSSTYKASRQAIAAYKSQFYDPDSLEPETFISREDFLKGLDSKARIYGEMIGATFGDGFLLNRALGIKSISSVFV